MWLIFAIVDVLWCCVPCKFFFSLCLWRQCGANIKVTDSQRTLGEKCSVVDLSIVDAFVMLHVLFVCFSRCLWRQCAWGQIKVPDSQRTLGGK